MRLSALTLAAAAASTFLSGASLAEVPSAERPGQVPEPRGLHQGAMHGYTPNEVSGGQTIDTAALAKLIETSHPVLLDVAEKDRKPPSMGPGMIWLPQHRSILGAVFLEGGGSGTADATYAADFKQRIAALTGDNMATPIVTFCHPDCWGSYNAAKRLVGLGYTKVYWYRDGVEGWQAEHDTKVVRADKAWLDALPKDATQ